MYIYLARHGDAIYLQPDELSPLSPKGEKEIEALAAFLTPLQLRAAIFHSGKLRAQQTAERLAAGMLVNGTVTARAGLNSADSVSPIAEELNKATTDILLVGHMPFMAKLVAQLINKNEGQDIVHFHKGTIMCLESKGYQEWVIQWVIHPGLII
ncbi:MAG: Phosphohistidine phosphatase SixA [Gammaproteobacteria bacterium]|jgi:phosphohistidine phosphatase|nr:Phosphohistidine phosphatase SixA [Gammaproteobacteria bacterium]